MANIQLTPKTSIFQRGLSLLTRTFSRKDQEVVQNHFEAKKVKDYEEDDFKEMAKNIRHISIVHFGIQAPIADLAMMSIIRMIKRHFADLSQPEILDAFEACAAGEYDSEKEKMKPYGSFSVAFVGQVLNAYCRNKNQVLKKLDRAKTVKELNEPKEYVSNEKIYMRLEEYYKTKGELPIYWLWESAYLHLLETGKVKEMAGYEDRQQELFRYLKQSIHV